jgi:hypothetical protein
LVERREPEHPVGTSQSRRKRGGGRCRGKRTADWLWAQGAKRRRAAWILHHYNKNKKRNERKPSHPPPITALVVRTYVGVRVRRKPQPGPVPTTPLCTTTAPPNHARTAFLIGTELFASAAASSAVGRRGHAPEPMTGGRVTTSGAGDGQAKRRLPDTHTCRALMRIRTPVPFASGARWLRSFDALALK